MIRQPEALKMQALKSTPVATKKPSKYFPTPDVAFKTMKQRFKFHQRCAFGFLIL